MVIMVDKDTIVSVSLKRRDCRTIMQIKVDTTLRDGLIRMDLSEVLREIDTAKIFMQGISISIGTIRNIVI